MTRTDMASEIQTIAVIGAGDQGREIALAALLAGYRTFLEDVSENRLERAAASILSSANVGAEARSRLVLASEVEEAVREADLIVEAVAEEMEMKIEMFTIFDKFAKPDAIFASSSPSLSISELAAVTFCPDRCIGLRFVPRPGKAQPVAQGGVPAALRLLRVCGKENALELVCTPQTSEETVSRCRQVGRRMGKEVMVVAEKEFTESR
jgi:3-hydroxyacyl-CoA dehydrogenase